MTPDPGEPLILRTERLVLRPLDDVLARAIDAGRREADWADGFPQAGDVAIAGMQVAALPPVALPARGDLPPGDRPPGDLPGRGEVDARWGAWTVRTLDGTLIGTAGFHGPPVDGEVEVGYGIEPGHRGRGLANEALSALLAFAGAAGARGARARVAPGNGPSLRLLASLGFERVLRSPRASDEDPGEVLELWLALGP